ncbi:MAG: GTPase HflX [Gammaproteobacteria bacterium]|nr:GTPase HflX [Gammaproteobacteria bacterium]
MFDRPDSGDKTLLVHVGAVPAEKTPDEVSEFQELAVSAGLEVCDLLTGTRSKPDPKTFVGSGKLDEIKAAARMHGVELVLFSQKLSPSQERNLEKLLDVRVLDRTSLILDIFAQRARTYEGKLQVELAQLEHLSTRLVRGWTHLERQKGGIGLRGPGETQLETDRRLLGIRVKTIRSRLERVRKQREQGRQSRARSGTATVALVGYTNAGKSTLFNRLTNEKVYAADQLFATLDPTLRRLNLQGGRHVVLADTVGFIRHLPHALVDAFRSTLTETREATLLLHVVDVSDEDRSERMADVDYVLKEIDAGGVPQLIVYNKLDQLDHGPDRPHIDRDSRGRPVAVWVSALRDLGLDELKTAITELTTEDRISGWIVLSPAQGKERARMHQQGAVIDESVLDDGRIVCHIDVDQAIWDSWCSDSDLARQFTADLPALAAAGQGQ